MAYLLQKSLVKSKYIINNKIKKSTSSKSGSKSSLGTITGNFFLPAADALGSSSPRSSSSSSLLDEWVGVGTIVAFAPKFKTYQLWV